MLSFFLLDVLDEIWDSIESVSRGFPTYSFRNRNICNDLNSKENHFMVQKMPNFLIIVLLTRNLKILVLPYPISSYIYRRRHHTFLVLIGLVAFILIQPSIWKPIHSIGYKLKTKKSFRIITIDLTEIFSSKYFITDIVVSRKTRHICKPDKLRNVNSLVDWLRPNKFHCHK